MKTTIDLPEEVRSMVLDARDAILRSSVKPDLLVLYGSQARGDATVDSDIDLLVVVEGNEQILVPQVRQAVYQVMWDHDFARLISVRVVSRDRYAELKRKGYSFAKNVEQDGVVLWQAA